MLLISLSGLYSDGSSESLPEPVPEMGTLGYRLKTPLTIEGIRKAKRQGKLTHARMILVDTVNDVKLEKPIPVHIKNVNTDALEAGARCIFKGYESGNWIGCDTCQSPRQFFHYFVVSDVIQPQGLKGAMLPAGPGSYADDTIGALSVDDMPMGSLGYKLGTYLTIEGIRAEKGKVGIRTLLVDTVNGGKTDMPVYLWMDNVESLPEGERVVVRGYESGKMIGIPDEVLEKEHLAQPQVRWEFYRYFIITSAVQPADLKFTRLHAASSAVGSRDAIDELADELSGNPLWMNGIYPSIKLSEKAGHEKVISECFKMTGFEKGHVKDYKIIAIKKVKIRGPLPDDYFAALTDTDLGKKIVLFRYENPDTGWWARVYDLPRPRVANERAPVASSDAALQAATAFLKEKRVDVSRHDMSAPEGIQEIRVRNQRAWRVSWKLKDVAVDGGQLIVIVYESGKCEQGWGE